jgi:hypothetical protein
VAQAGRDCVDKTQGTGRDRINFYLKFRRIRLQVTAF